MKMSTRGQYALEIAVDLALHLMPDRLESLNDIAKRRNLSEKYLERIKYFHLKGVNENGVFCALDQGEIDFGPILKLLKGCKRTSWP